MLAACAAIDYKLATFQRVLELFLNSVASLAEIHTKLATVKKFREVIGEAPLLGKRGQQGLIDIFLQHKVKK
jgi:hypothetical protein